MVTSRRYFSVVKPWHRKPSATSPATSVISSPTPARKIFGRAVRVRARVEERRHQRVRVEVAAEVELRAVVPAVPDGADGEDHLPHARRRVAPRHREALGDVRLDLAAEAEDEPALRERLQVVADVGQQHRVAGERDGDGRAELDLLRVLGGEQQREERVVARLGGPDAGVARLLALPWPRSPALSRSVPMPPSTFMAGTVAAVPRCQRRLAASEPWSRRNRSSSAASSSPDGSGPSGARPTVGRSAVVGVASPPAGAPSSWWSDAATSSSRRARGPRRRCARPRPR